MHEYGGRMDKPLLLCILYSFSNNEATKILHLYLDNEQTNILLFNFPCGKTASYLLYRLNLFKLVANSSNKLHNRWKLRFPRVLHKRHNTQYIYALTASNYTHIDKNDKASQFLMDKLKYAQLFLFQFMAIIARSK